MQFFLSSKTTVKRGECNVNREKLRIETGIQFFSSEHTNESIGFTLPLAKCFFSHFRCCFQLTTNQNSFSFVDFRQAFFCVCTTKILLAIKLIARIFDNNFSIWKPFHRSAPDQFVREVVLLTIIGKIRKRKHILAVKPVPRQAIQQLLVFCPKENIAVKILLSIRIYINEWNSFFG